MSVRRFRPSFLEIIFWLGSLVAITSLVLAMLMPLRVAKAEIGGFPQRKMYLRMMTGMSETKQKYIWFGEEICKHYRVSVAELSDPTTSASNDALANALS